MSNFSAFLEIQDGGQKEIIRPNLNFDFQSESYRFILATMHFCDAY